MPRASLNPDKAKSGGGIESGNYEVITAKCANIKTDFKPVQPAMVFSVRTLDKNGAAVPDTEDQELALAFGEKASSHFSPGIGQSITDADPKDAGKDVDAEGNTVYCEEGAQFNSSSGALVFLKSLAKHGFPQDVLDACWMPSFVGLKIFLQTLPAKDINEGYGTRLNVGNSKDGQPFTYKVAAKWLNPSYLGKSSTPAATPATNGSATASQVAASTPTPASAANGTKVTVPDAVKMCIAKLADKKKGKTIEIRSSLNGFLTNELSALKLTGVSIAEFKKALADDDMVKDALTEAKATLALDDNTAAWTGGVTFAE